jgi:hypothetical protein
MMFILGEHTGSPLHKKTYAVKYNMLTNTENSFIIKMRLKKGGLND